MDGVRIYNNSQMMDNTYYVKRGSKVVLFHAKDGYVHRESTLKWLFHFSRMIIPEVKPDTQEHFSILNKYKDFIRHLPLSETQPKLT